MTQEHRLVYDVERVRQALDYDNASALIKALSELIYTLQS